MPNPDLQDLDKRLAVVETKLEIHASLINEIRNIVSKLDEKLDTLITEQAKTKVKQAIYFGGSTSIVVIIAEILIRKFLG